MIALLFSSVAFAASFKGYPIGAHSDSMREKLDRVVETPTAFLLLPHEHEAFYEFPKSSDTRKLLLSFFSESMKTKRALKIEFDPMTLQISKVSTSN